MSVDKSIYDISLYLPQHFKSFKSRELTWVWSFLSETLMWQWSIPWPSEYNISLIQQAMFIKREMENHPNANEIVAAVLNAHGTMLVSEDFLKWIDEKDHRLLIWLIHQAHALGILPSVMFVRESRYKLFVKFLDLNNSLKEQKIQFLLNSQASWVTVKTPDQQIKWLDKTNSTQIEWAWIYLMKFNKSISIPPPATLEEMYDAVIASIDFMSYGIASDKELFLSKMKKTWSQKKFRDSGKAKKPYHLPLSKKVRDYLEWLSKFTDSKPADVLERLITEEYAKHNIDEKGKTRF